MKMEQPGENNKMSSGHRDTAEPELRRNPTECTIEGGPSRSETRDETGLSSASCEQQEPMRTTPTTPLGIATMTEDKEQKTTEGNARTTTRQDEGTEPLAGSPENPHLPDPGGGSTTGTQVVAAPAVRSLNSSSKQNERLIEKEASRGRQEDALDEGGHDRVSVDFPNQPLVPTLASQQSSDPQSPSLPPRANEATSSAKLDVDHDRSRTIAANQSPPQQPRASTVKLSNPSLAASAQALPSTAVRKTDADSTPMISIPQSLASGSATVQQHIQPSQSKIPTIASTPAPPRKLSNASTVGSTRSSQKHPQQQHTSENSEGGVSSALEEQLQQQRAPLTDRYGPYIIESDTCLEDARKRLRTALEQTRRLRAAFTERVYGKYRVCLRQPLSTQKVIAAIHADPVASQKRIDEEIRLIREEKEAEKKEAHKLNSELAAQTGGVFQLPLNVDNAEQLMYLSSGLNLVILPEEPVDASEVRGYTDRGPVNPETGMRVKGISQAAATAGELMLDRKRKAAVMRLERQRGKHRLQLVSGEEGVDTSIEPNDVQSLGDMACSADAALFSSATETAAALAAIPSIEQASTLPSSLDSVAVVTATGTASSEPEPSTATTAAVFPEPTVLVPKPSSTQNPKLASTTPNKSQPTRLKGPKQQQQPYSKPGSFKPAPASNQPSTTSSAKSLRARNQSALTVSTLLSLNPSADELKTDGKVSSSCMALKARGVGSATAAASSRAVQQRLRHPHPESAGGRRRSSLNLSASKGKESPNHSDPFQQAYLALTLPPIPAAKERRDRRPVPVCKPDEAATKRSSDAVREVLEQFIVDESVGKTIRNVTKIELMHKIWKLGNEMNDSKLSHAANVEQPITSEQHVSTSSSQQQADRNPCSTPIGEPPPPDSRLDPIIAFSVLHAVGFIGRSTHGAIQSSLQLPTMDEDNKQIVVQSDKMKRLRRNLNGSTQTLTEVLFGRTSDIPGDASLFAKAPGKRVVDSQANDSRDNKRVRTGEPENQSLSAHDDVALMETVPVESIRGGGEVLLDATDEADVSEEKVDVEKASAQTNLLRARSRSQSDDKSNNRSKSRGRSQSEDKLPKNKTESEGKRSSASSPGRATAKPPQNSQGTNSHRGHHTMPPQRLDGNTIAYMNTQMPGAPPAVPSAATMMPAYLNPSDPYAMHLTNQLRHGVGSIHHSASDLGSGSLAYLALHHQQQPYDFASFMPGASQGGMPGTPSSMAALGLARSNPGMMAYAVDEREAAARAFYAREQQTMALMRGGAPHGFVQTPPATFHANSHPAAGNGMASPSPQPLPLLGQHQYGIRATGPMQSAVSHSQYPLRAPPASDNSLRKETSENPSNPTKQEAKHKPVAPKNNPASVNPKNDKIASKQVFDTNPANGSVSSSPPEDGKVSYVGAQSLEITVMEKSDPASASPPQVDKAGSPGSDERGIKFFPPNVPPLLTSEEASLIRQGRFHEVAAQIQDLAKLTTSLEYLMAMGSAVPIPKALVQSPLKERLNTPGFRNAGNNGAPAMPRDVVVSSILVWLWDKHEQNFQQAFEKSGRLDVDPDCKWLIQAAVDTAVRDLTLEIADSMARGQGPFAEASNTRKGQALLKPCNAADQGIENDKVSISKKMEIHTASIVSKALMTELGIDRQLNFALPQFHSLAEYLDETRLAALHARSQERALLAAFVARTSMMSETFSQSYVGAMVRAGEALGHGELFESVQNEDVMASSMMPYDIFTDENDIWEDPCKPSQGYTAGLNGDELLRRAHARAVIHKSLRKMQDRHGLRGGVQSVGPYGESSSNPSFVQMSNAIDQSGKPAISSPRPGIKRRISSIAEPPVPVGTGSAAAKSWHVYDPKHFSAPLEWEAGHSENLPYGRQSSSEKARALPGSLGRGEPRGGKKARRATSFVAQPLFGSSKSDAHSKINRSTHEIDWGDVAGIFQRVEIPRKSPTSKGPSETLGAATGSKEIFAPFCRRIDDDKYRSVESESESEEDLSEEIYLSNHQNVLDEMKEKMAEFMEVRRREQEKRKNRKN